MTDVALKEYLEKRIEELDKRVSLQIDNLNSNIDQHFSTNDIALSKAEQTMNARLDSMNEFRDALKDQAGRMATRVELSVIELQVQELRRDKANLDGRLAMIAVIISIIVSLAARYVMK